MLPTQRRSLLVNQSNIRQTQIDTSAIPTIKDGEVLIAVDQFALTANNITYAAIGEMLQYWNFFPTDVEGYGIVPVWGYAKIISSKHPEIKEDAQIYGYLPMSDYFIAKPGNISAFGFKDSAAHRQQNAAIYNNYEFLLPDQSKHASYQFVPIIRPLFTTSFLLYHFFTDEDYMDAIQIVLTSASSKTSLALASMIKENGAKRNIKVIGLTSKSNLSFVSQSNLYDQVIEYGESGQIEHKPTVIADFAGNRNILKTIDDRLGDNLKHIVGIGLTDWESNKEKIQLSKAKMFFAPTYAQVKLKEWGPAKGMKMISESMMHFIEFISTHIAIETSVGFENMQALYGEMVEGKVNPQIGHILYPRKSSQ